MGGMLKHFEIKNFRCFKHLPLENLGRVNLIVGKNNVGKSTVLEALALYARRAFPSDVIELLAERNEFHIAPDLGNKRVPVEILFNQKDVPVILTADNDPMRSLSLELCVANLEENDIGTKKWVLNPNGNETVLKVGFSNKILIYRPFSEIMERYERWLSAETARKVNSNKGEPSADIYDLIGGSYLEDHVIDVLRLIEPKVQRLVFVMAEGSDRRFPKVRLQGYRAPIPLASMGDGMTRLLTIALASVTAKDGFLLLDEVENGIHYEIQPDLWRTLFKLAEQLNLQVFATTHSADCIAAFTDVADEMPAPNALIRLYRDGDSIQSATFSETDLLQAKKHRLEFR